MGLGHTTQADTAIGQRRMGMPCVGETRMQLSGQQSAHMQMGGGLVPPCSVPEPHLPAASTPFPTSFDPASMAYPAQVGALGICLLVCNIVWHLSFGLQYCMEYQPLAKCICCSICF